MPELRTLPRMAFGKKVKQLRRAGLVPGEMYGHDAKNRHVSVAAKDLAPVYRKTGTHAMVTLVDEKSGEKIPALIVDIQNDPISQAILSVDFHQVRMDEKIQAPIPVSFKGEAPALKKGFIIIRVLNEIEVEALPTAIPDHFEADLTKLEDRGQSIHVRDLAIPLDVKVLVPHDTVIATVSERTKEEEIAAPSLVAPETAPSTPTVAAPEEAPPAGAKREKDAR